LFTGLFANGHGEFSPWGALCGHEIERLEQVEVFSIANVPFVPLRGSFDPDGGTSDKPWGSNVVVDFRTHNTSTVVFQAVLEPEVDGGGYSYEIPTPDTPGTYDMSLQYDHCLRRTVTVDTTDLDTEVDLTLLNGDINRDNTVDIGDYAILSTYYEYDDSDEEVWNAPDPETLIAAVDCDLNGDGTVDIGDYGILSTNMDESGDD
jgi:hypothetical protein